VALEVLVAVVMVVKILTVFRVLLVQEEVVEEQAETQQEFLAAVVQVS
jgi:hypothetical protein